MPLDRGGKTVVAAFLVSGVVHLVRPQVFVPVVPRVLPHKRFLVHASGVAELVCAVGLLRPGWRRWAAPASAALLAAVLPANVQMAWDQRRSPSFVWRTLLWARVPLQAPLVRAALRARQR